MSKRLKDGDEHLRKKRARSRFKRIVRIALANVQWITEVEDQGITLNVKKNVAMLVRKKHKTGILTMAQKGLLALPHRSRTIPERMKLCTIVANLGCFTQIPPKLRARLVPYLHFMSVAANRVLMKEGDIPTAIYFVVSGEVEMSRKFFNQVTRRIESKPEAFFGPGDWIGEVEVLESNIRMNTYRATTNCEILILDDFDFEAILKPYVAKVWGEKKKAIASLSYLKYMNESQIVSACKFGIIRQYDPLDTIYPESKDNVSHVYFVLSGECVLLQCLHMKVSVVKGEVQYELPEAVNEQSDSDGDDDGRPEPFDVRELLRSSSSLDELGHNKKKAKRKAEFARIQQNCLLLKEKLKVVEEPTRAALHRAKSLARMSRVIKLNDKESMVMSYDYEDYEGDLSEDDDDNDGRISTPLLKGTSRTSKLSRMSRTSNLLFPEAESEGSEIFTATSSSATSSETTSSIKTKPHHGESYATHFIDIGSMYFGGLFGIGEKCDHRVVMARTTVQCLLIPRYWLMEEDQNPGHIWQRMRFYLDRCIPSRQTLFKDFINTRKWAKFKRSCVEGFVEASINPAKIEDIPIVIRIVESKAESHDRTT